MGQLDRPTYQGSLRAIGRYFDQKTYRHILIVEMEDGFIIRVFADGGNIKAEGIELPMSDIISLITSYQQARGKLVTPVKTPPLCPTGYEDFLRALGYELDELKVTGLRVIELSTGIVVSFAGLNRRNEIERYETLYDKARIDEALVRGYQRRRSEAIRLD